MSKTSDGNRCTGSTLESLLREDGSYEEAKDHAIKSVLAYKLEQETTASRIVLDNAVAAAEQVIEARERTVLPATDWDAFHDALLNPPPPNLALRRASRRYRERIGG